MDQILEIMAYVGAGFLLGMTCLLGLVVREILRKL